MRNVRNFWIDGNVDGSATVLRGGPRSKDGGFTLRVHMRDAGSPALACTLRGWTSEGKLILDIEEGDLRLSTSAAAGTPTVRVVTER